jgi:uncharacterized protein (TIGR00369 family)
MPASSVPRSAPSGPEVQSTCFVCGPTHPNGLHVRFTPTADGSVRARWKPEHTWEGFHGFVHGGIVSTLLDEAMSKAVAAHGCVALTAELKVRFRHPVSPDQEVVIRGWVLDRCKRRIRTEAAVTSADGHELSHAWGVFLSAAGSGPAADRGADPR